MNKKIEGYVPLKFVFFEEDDSIEEMELWINENIKLLIMYESLISKNDISYLEDFDFISFDIWMKSPQTIIKKIKKEYYLDQDVVIMVKLDNPFFKLNLIFSIYKIPEKQREDFFDNLFFENDEEDSDNDK